MFINNYNSKCELQKVQLFLEKHFRSLQRILFSLDQWFLTGGARTPWGALDDYGGVRKYSHVFNIYEIITNLFHFAYSMKCIV